MRVQTEMVQILREDGSYDLSQLPSLADAELRQMYEWMVFTRALDQRALLLQRQGRMGTYVPGIGQEAAQVGSAWALERDDWMFPAYREAGAWMVHGLPPDHVLLYWGGREEGASPPPGVNVFPISIPIATQLPHAVGAAMAARIQGHPRVIIVYFGDGATSEGDFHEAANFAGRFRAPVVFFCSNNQYAISVPFHRQTATETIAQKAVAYGFPGVRVDGNDVLAVYQVTREAVDRARSGEGPTLIEAVTYRYGPHTTADDPGRYRSEVELRQWQEQRDAIQRMRLFLESRGLWSDQEEAELEARVREEVAAVVERVESLPPTDPRHMFEFMYSSPPPHLREQRDALLAELEERAKRQSQGQ